MKWVVMLLAFINGAWMLADGIFVLLKGKYIGPEKPGPWAELFYRLGVNVFKLGPLFVFFGVLWLLFVVGLWANQSWAYFFGLVIALLSLWYLPFGTLISVTILVMLIFFKHRITY